MSYTLRGRLESRLAALLAPLAVACALGAAIHEWWPVALAATMIAVGFAFDLGYHPALPYQPGWAALPLGLLELGAVMGVVYALDIHAPLAVAIPLFALGWAAAQLLGHALLPLWRLSYAEDGGELGRAGALLAVAVAVPLAAAGGLWYVRLPPTIHLAAGVHQGPLVLDERQVLVGDPGAVVRGGIVVRHDDVTISHVSVVGGVNGITVDGYDNVVLDHVTVKRATMDAIHVRASAVTIRHCTIDMRGMRYGQGIDISYGMVQGTSTVDRCNVVGGQDGIVTHGSMAMFMHNHVTNTTQYGIAMTEMSMGSLEHNTVSNAKGVGMYCGDRSMCEIARNVVRGTRADSAGGDKTRAGFGLEVLYGAEADLSGNDFKSNPLSLGVFLNSRVRWIR
ncbi:MAG: hypothetical protein QOK22_1926 [Gaiellaceae bacterium]|nr:hypothetical protein [Gaiellaceae bacterium]